MVLVLTRKLPEIECYHVSKDFVVHSFCTKKKPEACLYFVVTLRNMLVDVGDKNECCTR